MKSAIIVIHVQSALFDMPHATVRKIVDPQHMILPTTARFGTCVRTVAGTNPGYPG